MNEIKNNIAYIYERKNFKLGVFCSIILHLSVFIVLFINFSKNNKPIRQSVFTVELLPIAKTSNIKQQKLLAKSKNIIKVQKNKKGTSSKNKTVNKIGKVRNKNNIDNKVKSKIKKTPRMRKSLKVQPKSNNINHDFDHLLKSLEQNVKTKHMHKQRKKAEGHFDRAKQLSISQKDDIKRQISRCWSPPSGGLGAGEINILLKIILSKSGDVENVMLMKVSNNVNTDIVRASIDAAIRAVRKCSPITNLPVDKYESWQELEINFDPHEMVY